MSQVQLDYAQASTEVPAVEDIPADWLIRWRSGLGWLWAATILSPLCIVACLFHVAVSASVLTAFLITLVFGLTVMSAVFAQQRLSVPGVSDGNTGFRLSGEIVAGTGLGLICLAAWVSTVTLHQPGNDAKGTLLIVALGFALLTLGVPRFVHQYRALAAVQKQLDRRHRGKFLIGVGYGKIPGDGILVACMALGLFIGVAESEVAVFFGLGALYLGFPAYAIVWVISAVGHGLLTANVVRACRAVR
ncbi:MAG: hypothetical protein AAF743_06275 [Planctomycetota bacterium]